MGGTKRSVAALAALAAALAVTPSAGAQEEVTPKFSLEGTFHTGTEFFAQVEEDTCPGGPVSITSPGFVAPVDLTRRRGRFSNLVGAALATLKCKDTTKEGTFQFSLTPPPDASKGVLLDKEVYAPGETIMVHAGHPSCEFRTALSDGFVAPAVIHDGYGVAKAIDTPGTYVMSLACAMTGEQYDQFTIKAPGKPKPTPPVVKPKGAPDTGGGGTA
jgi:hypothetical protein